MRSIITLLILCLGCSMFAQNTVSNYRSKKVHFNDTINIDSISINNSWFKVKLKNKALVDTSYYRVNFKKAVITFKKPLDTDSLIIEYLRFPEYITKTYRQLDESIVVDNTDDLNKLYRLSNLVKLKILSHLTVLAPLEVFQGVLLWVIIKILF